MRATNRRLLWTAFAAAFVLLVGLSLSGISARLNGGIYDQFMRLAPGQQHAALVTLVVYDQAPGQARLSQFVEVAKASQVRALIMPVELQSEFGLGASSSDSSLPSGAELPIFTFNGAKRTDPCAPLMEHGIHRRMSAECFRSALAVLDAQLAQPAATYLVDFAAGSSHIPRLTLEQAADDQWLADVARDRLVLLAPETASDAYLATPLDGSQGISASEYRAYALDTMLAQRSIAEFGLTGVALSIFLMLLLGALLTQWLPAITGAVMAVVMMLLITVGSWFVLHVWHWWLPVTELNLAALGALFVTAQSRRSAEEVEVGAIERRLGGIVARRLTPRGIEQAEDPWPEVQRFLTMHLNLSKSILLELPRGGHHVREVVSYGCSIDDIFERRRDCRRSPYKEAAAQVGPARLNRQFLEQPTSAEVDYLTPLVFGNETIGFWYTSFADEMADAQPTIHDLQLFAEHTSRLLARWRADREEQRPRGLLRSLLPELWPRRYRSLEYASNVIEERIVTVERILNDLGRPTLVFDLFGRLTLSNRAAEELARTEKIALYSTDALSALTQWCELETVAARDLLRDVILNQEDFNVPLLGLSLPLPHVLHIRGIRLAEEPAAGQQAELVGVLMELLDVSKLHQSHRWFEDLTAQFAQKVRNDLEAVALAWQRVRKDLPEQANRAVGVIERRLPSAAQSMEVIQEQVETARNWNSSNLAPLDARDCFERAMSRVKIELERSAVDVAVNLPAFLTLAFARRQELDDLLVAALRLLADDAVADGQIRVSFEEQTEPKPLVNIALSNDGYGMPGDHVERMMATGRARLGETDLLAELAERCFAIERWGGQVEVRSEVGQGFVVSIDLRGLKL